MECSQGMLDVSKYDCIVLNKLISGCVHAARQYYKNAVENLKKLGCIQVNDDPCLYVKKNKKDILYLALYVDGNLMMEDVDTLDELITAFGKTGCS